MNLLSFILSLFHNVFLVKPLEEYKGIDYP
jgi:hypothetical protein